MRAAFGAFLTVVACMALWAAGAPMAVLRATHDGQGGQEAGWIAADCGHTLGALAAIARHEEDAPCATRAASTREGRAAMTWLLENARDPHVAIEVRLGMLAVPFAWDAAGSTLAERRAAIAARRVEDEAHRDALREALSDVRLPRPLRIRALAGMETMPGRLGTVDAHLRAAAIPLLRERAVRALAGVDPAWEATARAVAESQAERAARCGTSTAAMRPSPAQADAPRADATHEALAAAVSWLREVDGPARVARLYDLTAPLGEAPGPACEEGDLAAALAGVPAPGTAETLARALGESVEVPVRAWVDGKGARWISLEDGLPRRARRIEAGTAILEDTRPRPPAR
jgi:hypothetical protein